MATFKLDGVEIPFEAGETVIAAARKQGMEIPHYCWHPGLSAPANCRMCLVEVLPKPGTRPMMLDLLELDPATGEYVPAQKPKLQPACQFQAADGLEVLCESSDHVKRARAAVQELLLLNHPVDCPICDQAGECKLQDYWLEHGAKAKRMHDEPVHKPKAVSFGPTIVYDAERCVMCTRCIRFMKEVAHDPVLGMRERGNLNEIVVAPGRELDGHYTLMTENVCPVGALTAKDFRFKARVWFLKSANVVCQGCATGCNASLDFDPRHNLVMRLRPRENPKVNQFWMCDEGMLSYLRAHENRVTEASLQGIDTTVDKAIESAAKSLSNVERSKLSLVFSAQHSLEDNFALREIGTLLGASEFFVAAHPDGYEDTILINKDKNPNSRGVRVIAEGARPVADLEAAVSSGKVTHILALGGELPGQPDSVYRALSAATTIVLAAHGGEVTQSARIVLPATSWAEQSGTYVNSIGMRQVSDRAITPLGASLPAWEHLRTLASALGHDVSWTKLKSLRNELSGALAAQDLSSDGDLSASP